MREASLYCWLFVHIIKLLTAKTMQSHASDASRGPTDWRFSHFVIVPVSHTSHRALHPVKTWHRFAEHTVCYSVCICVHMCMLYICIYGQFMSMYVIMGITHKWVRPQMSVWESSFVTKQSHLDSSGRRHSLMLSHRLRVTKSPSGSAGHVGHMSACGCLGFSALNTYANTHKRADCYPAHVYTRS